MARGEPGSDTARADTPLVSPLIRPTWGPSSGRSWRRCWAWRCPRSRRASGRRARRRRSRRKRRRARRGRAYAELSDWDRAVADFAAARRAEPRTAWHAHRQAWAELARAEHRHRVAAAVAAAASLSTPWAALAVGSLRAAPRDTRAFRDTCARMRRAFPDPRDPSTADALAYTRVLSPGRLSAKEAEELVVLSRVAVKAEPDNANYPETHGAALYRAGRYGEAIDQLVRAVEKTGEGGTVWQRLFLAMAHHRAGHPKEARDRLAKAVRQIGEGEKRAPAPHWEHRLTRRLLREEAEALLRSP